MKNNNTMDNSSSKKNKPLETYSDERPKGEIPKAFFAEGLRIHPRTLLRRCHAIWEKKDITNFNSFTPKQIDSYCDAYGDPDWSIINELIHKSTIS